MTCMCYLVTSRRELPSLLNDLLRSLIEDSSQYQLTKILCDPDRFITTPIEESHDLFHLSIVRHVGKEYVVLTIANECVAR